MKIFNHFMIMISAICIACVSCKKEEALQIQEDTRSSYFLPNPSAMDEESVLRRTFYVQEKSYLLFNDTLRHELLGTDYNGDKQYFTETLNLGYILGTTENGSYVFKHALFENVNQKKAAVDFMKNYVLSHLSNSLRPYSWLVTKSTAAIDIFGTATYPIAIPNHRCIGVAIGDIQELSDLEKIALANTILSTTLSYKLSLHASALSKFYSVSESLYGGQFPLKVMTEEANLEALNQRGFIVQEWIFEGFLLNYGAIPSREKDLDSYIKLIFNNTSAEVDQVYANYPIVRQKYALLKDMLSELGYKK